MARREAAGSRRLDSWKEIAEYLGRDVTTAIRWEKKSGLPVRRVPGDRRRRPVFAYTGEIDAWLAGSRRRTATPPRSPFYRLLWSALLRGWMAAARLLPRPGITSSSP
jgi:hypothetical protein